ncbi:MAG: PAS domain-containing protein, partial [Verrucomicrobiota bacterium]|nr:PAS domain-containing protein [Verrucomicrobiota bacterium]
LPELLKYLIKDGDGRRRAGVWEHRRKDGSALWADIYSNPIVFEGKKARMSIIVDVTQKLAAENQLRASEQEQRALVTQLEMERTRLVAAQAVAKLGSWETEWPTGALQWSEETHRIFETDPSVFQPSHEKFLNLLEPDERARVDRAFRNSVEKPGAHSIEHRLLMADGRIKFIDERWQVCLDDQGAPRSATGTSHDITERREAGELLRQSEARFSSAFEDAPRASRWSRARDDGSESTARFANCSDIPRRSY